jgi:hypothetical protein
VHYIFISVKSLTGNYLYSMSLILKVPTLNDDIQDFERLFSLHQQAINSDKEHLILDFSDCQFLRHNAVAFIGGLVRFNQLEGKNVRIDWRSFVTQHNGTIRIISHNGYVLLTKDGVTCRECSSSFEGTLINIKLYCDESRYYKRPNRPNKPWFQSGV